MGAAMNRRQVALRLPAAALMLGPLAARAQAPLAGRTTFSPLLHAIGGPQRSPALKARDPYRHPAETLAFWGLAPGITVVEIDPSGGYWTEILAPYLKATGGRYIAAMGDNPKTLATFKARFADEALWGPIEIATFTPTSGPLLPAPTADLLFTARNIHDWMWTPGLFEKALKDFHAALKPQALLGVEEHRADPRPMVAEARDGYVNTDFIVAEAKKAGFRLEAQSEINANPKDTKDYPFGVWTLPPTRRQPKPGAATPPGFDPAKYEAIGESDRMTLRFRRA
jgi:predicted methyltransferase